MYNKNLLAFLLFCFSYSNIINTAQQEVENAFSKQFYGVLDSFRVLYDKSTEGNKAENLETLLVNSAGLELIRKFQRA